MAKLTHARESNTSFKPCYDYSLYPDWTATPEPHFILILCAYVRSIIVLLAHDLNHTTARNVSRQEDTKKGDVVLISGLQASRSHNQLVCSHRSDCELRDIVRDVKSPRKPVCIFVISAVPSVLHIRSHWHTGESQGSLSTTDCRQALFHDITLAISRPETELEPVGHVQMRPSPACVKKIFTTPSIVPSQVKECRLSILRGMMWSVAELREEMMLQAV